MKIPLSHQSKGFGLTEAIVLTIILAVLIAVLPRLMRPKARGCPRPNCVINQKQLGIGFRGFAIDLGATPMKLGDANSVAGEPKP